jgi:hypothetical protein
VWFPIYISARQAGRLPYKGFEPMNNKQVAEFFVEQNVLQPSQVEDVLSEAELNGKSLEQAMGDGGFIKQLPMGLASTLSI